jgi:hypothetical protein
LIARASLTPIMLDDEKDILVSVGLRIVLDPGYVNARRRHPSGHRWFVRGRRASSPSPRVRLPAVVTCRCGGEILLEGEGAEASFYATATDSERQKKLKQDMDAAVGTEAAADHGGPL